MARENAVDDREQFFHGIVALRVVAQLQHQGFPGADDKRREYDWYRSNSAEPGPNDLARHSMKYDSHCIGHGDGTYNLIKGVFS